MKSIKQITKEIDSLLEERNNRESINSLIKIKKPAVRSKFDYCFVSFWKTGNDCESECEVELNKKESELLRRFLYAMKKRSLTA